LIALVLTVGTLLLLMLASTLLLISDVVIQHVAGQTPTFSSGILMFWQFLTLPLALGIMSIAFAWIYRLGPSYWQPGQPLFPGAILAAVSWACLSNSLRQAFLYFGPRNQVYGVVGAVIVLLLWLYISSLVLLLGEQLNFTVGEAMQEARIETENIKNQKFN
jgi:membrane protein